MSDQSGGTPARRNPASLRWGVAILFAEAAVVGAYALFLIYADIVGDTEDLRRALAVTAYFVIFAAVFFGLAYALHRRRAWARGPAIVLELLLVPIGYTMASAGVPWLGVPVLVVGLAGAGLLLAPSSRGALGLR